MKSDHLNFFNAKVLYISIINNKTGRRNSSKRNENEIEIKYGKLYWLIGRNSNSIYIKIVLYKHKDLQMESMTNAIEMFARKPRRTAPSSSKYVTYRSLWTRLKHIKLFELVQ